MGIDCKKEGVNYQEEIEINKRLQQKGNKLKYRYLVTVIDNNPVYHSILSLGNNTFWCPVFGDLPKMRKDYLLQSITDLQQNKVIPHTYDAREVMKWCNANCNKRVQTKTVEKWFGKRDPAIVDAIKHILYWRHTLGY